MALIPDGPPRRFRWRGVTYEVAGAQGPERIGAEWWHLSAPPAPANASARLQALTRDYYLVEHQAVTASGSIAKDCTSARPLRRAGSCMDCLREQSFACVFYA